MTYEEHVGYEQLADLFDSFAGKEETWTVIGEVRSEVWHEAAGYLRRCIDFNSPRPEDFPVHYVTEKVDTFTKACRGSGQKTDRVHSSGQAVMCPVCNGAIPSAGFTVPEHIDLNAAARVRELLEASRPLPGDFEALSVSESNEKADTFHVAQQIEEIRRVANARTLSDDVVNGISVGELLDRAVEPVDIDQ